MRYHALMASQQQASFGNMLRAAIRAARSTQAELARQLKIDAGQVSRWVNDKAAPHIDTVQRIEEVLGVSLIESYSASTSGYELFVSAPITGLAVADISSHHDAVAEVIAAARQHVDHLYWPGEHIRATNELVAADLATERNMKILASCPAYLYLQFADIVHPSGALVEFGYALGRRMKTTLIIRSGLRGPYMLDGFGAVAASLGFLPTARIYHVESVQDAVMLIARNGRELLGLQGL